MHEAVKIPIIKLHGNLIVSIQVALSDPVIAQLKDDITDRIDTTKATGLVIDVSGIDIMDSYISRAIRDIGLIARLMNQVAHTHCELLGIVLNRATGTAGGYFKKNFAAMAKYAASAAT